MMNFQLVDAHKLKVMISEEEMEMRAITFAQLDYRSPRTKELLLTILTEARTQTGFDPRDTKLFIEVYPEPNGGCTLYFTELFHLEERMDYRSHQGVVYPLVFAFEDVNLMIDAAVNLFHRYSHRVHKSSLFHMGEDYMLILYPIAAADRQLMALMTEYGWLAGEGELYASYVREHGAPIVEDSAIDMISVYLS